MLTTKVGPDGRVLVPVELRRELGLRPGEALVASADAGRLVLESQGAVLARLQARFDRIDPTVSLVDELIDDRGSEVDREPA